MDEILLQVNNISVVYSDVIQVLKGVSLAVERNKIVSLLGSNGAGKTTTLRTVSGLLIDDRPNREGFPFQVANELASLRVYRQERLGRPADGHRDAPAGKADASFDSIPFVRESP